MNFKEWLELELYIEMAGGLPPYVPEEIPAEADLMVKRILTLAARPTTSKGTHNWMFNSHLYWHDKAPELTNKVLEMFKERFSHRMPETRGKLRTILKDLIVIIFQKDHGYGTRRHINYALSKNANPTAVLTQQYPDAIHRPDGKNPYKRKIGAGKDGYVQTEFQKKLRRASAIANKGHFGRPGASVADEATRLLWARYKEFLLANRDKFSSEIPDFDVWLKSQRRRAM
jgi:hypothetical protein